MEEAILTTSEDCLLLAITIYQELKELRQLPNLGSRFLLPGDRCLRVMLKSEDRGGSHNEVIYLPEVFAFSPDLVNACSHRKVCLDKNT